MLKNKLKNGQENCLSFDWEKLSKKAKDEARKHIMADPYSCDDCSDIYNRGDLLNHFGDKFLVCKKCVDSYSHIYK